MNLRLSKSKIAAAGVITAVLVGGGASIAAASGDASGPASAAVGADEQQTDGEQADGADGGPGSEQEGNEQESGEPTYTGSVTVPADNEADGQETEDSEAAEAAALESLATLTPAEAEQAAVAAVPGTVAQTELDNENGFVVYSVEITGTDGSVTEVKVDAGNGAVLAQETGEDDDPSEAADQPEGPGDAQD